ncbi:hypothetical protein Poly30_50370 [Planctomycetes bacterium Poly30]|uniref:Uncharacterized protein n=2 Tax=Saltatorellus ferox TaxID=2528018 RepID=A0A518EZH3_9BACT|nr:hypothetical protein Poly30_50370 [Planctomycetes bacterium Poly30]
MNVTINELDEQIRLLDGIKMSATASPIFLPSTVAPPSVDGILLRFASKSVRIVQSDVLGGDQKSNVRGGDKESDVLGRDKGGGDAITSLVLTRPFRSLRSNIAGATFAGTPGLQHPMSTAPLTYMGLKSARDEVQKMRIRGDAAEVFYLDGWRMLHHGPNYALVGSADDFHRPVKATLLHDWAAKALEDAGRPADSMSESVLTPEAHKRLRNNAFGLHSTTVLYDSQTAKQRTQRLFEQLQPAGSALTPLHATYVDVTSCTTSLRLLEAGLLKQNTLVALSHDHAWSLKNARNLSIIAMDHPGKLPPLPTGLVPDEEFSTKEALTRTIVVRGDELPELQRKAAASWFQQLGLRLRRSWTGMVGLQSFIQSELRDTGDPGLDFSYQDLQEFIDAQLILEIDPDPQSVRFLPL